MKLQPGQLVAEKYRIERALGEGGFAVVWAAREVSLGRLVAIKFLRSDLDDSARRRFDLEARALATLSHPHCVALFDYGEAPGGGKYIVTELVDGVSLDVWSKAASLRERVIVAQQIANAISYAHRESIVHRDLKPDNILVMRTQEGPRVKVLDFGIAKLSGTELQDVTKTGEVFGTPGYMSPEQLRAQRDIGPATDIYSLGVILYELFEEQAPYEGEGLALAMAHLRLEPAPMTRTPPHLRGLIESMMDKDADRRPTTMAAVAKALTATPAKDQPVPPRPQPAPRPSRRDAPPEPKPSPHKAYAALAIVAVVGLVLVFVASRPDEVIERREVHRPVSVVKSPPTAPVAAKPPPVVEARPDMGAPDLGPVPDGVVAEGCARPHPGHGRQPLIDREDGLLAHVPRSYRPNHPTPLVIVFHDFGQHASDILRNKELLELSERNGVILLVPKDTLLAGVWVGNQDYKRATRQLGFARSELCVDPSRIFILGFGNGGEVAQKMACGNDLIAAVATVGWRWADEDKCRRARRPTMVISTLGDPAAPVDGSTPCGDRDRALLQPRWSLARHEKYERMVHGCSESSTDVPTENGEVECKRHECEVDLVLCRTDGGRFWPGMVPAMPLFAHCASEGPNTANVAWTFFNEHGLTRTVTEE